MSERVIGVEVSHIFEYPVKSLPGYERKNLRRGISRRFCVYNPDRNNQIINYRTEDWMGRMRTGIGPRGELLLTNASGQVCEVDLLRAMAPITVNYAQKELQLPMVDCGVEVNRFLSEFADKEVGLAMRTPDTNRISVHNYLVGLEDEEPIHIVLEQMVRQILPPDYSTKSLRPDIILNSTSDLTGIKESDCANLWLARLMYLEYISQTKRCTMPNRIPFDQRTDPDVQFYAKDSGYRPFEQSKDRCLGWYFNYPNGYTDSGISVGDVGYFEVKQIN